MGLLLFSAGMILTALLAGFAALRMSSGGRKLPTGPGVSEAVVAEQATVASPAGPIVYGYVEVGARLRDGRTHRRVPLHREFRGHRDVAFVLESAPVTLAFTDALKQLKDFPAQVVQVDSLAGHPEEATVPDWRSQPADGGYYLQTIGLQTGEQVLLVRTPEGELDQVWRGGRAFQEARQEQILATNRRLATAMGGLGLLTLLAGLISGATALFR